ncbi:MAG: DUF423 domain-containing protein [Bryobacteraceae bacterium]
MNWSVTGAILLALAVALGAFGAHELRERVDAYRMGVFEKAAFYHFVHALGILAISILPRVGALTEDAAGTVCAVLLGGIVFFSGSLYLLAITGNRWLGAITPVGGVAFLTGWLLLAWRLRR